MEEDIVEWAEPAAFHLAIGSDRRSLLPSDSFAFHTLNAISACLTSRLTSIIFVGFSMCSQSLTQCWTARCMS